MSSIQIRIPSLSERLEDIPLLVQFFLKKYNDAYGKKLWADAPHPGGAVAASLAGQRARTGECDLQRLHYCLRGLRSIWRTCPRTCNIARRARRRATHERPLALDEIRKLHIQRVLDLCQGNRLRAAQMLGIGRTSLYRYLKRDEQQRVAYRTATDTRKPTAAADGLTLDLVKDCALEVWQKVAAGFAARTCGKKLHLYRSGNLRRWDSLEPTSNLKRWMIRSYASRSSRLCANLRWATHSSRLYANSRLKDFSQESCSAEGQIPVLVQKRICALSAKDTKGERYVSRLWHDPCTE